MGSYATSKNIDREEKCRWVLLRKFLSIYKSDDSSSTKAGGFVRVASVWRAGVHPFKQVKNGLVGAGGNEHTAGGAVSLDESLGVLNARWVLAGQCSLCL